VAGLPGEVGRFVQPGQLSRVPDQVDPGDPPVFHDEAHRGGLAGDLDPARRAIAQLYFAAPAVSYGHRDVAQQKQIVAEAFAGIGWRLPQLLEAMQQAPDFYFDTVSQVHLDNWSAGRVALVGDAACAARPGGNGTGNAVVAAYVLAGELAAAGGDHQTAFGRYQQLLRPYVAKGQKQARDGRDFLAPPTQKKITQLHRFYKMLPYLPVKHLMKYLTTRTAAGVKLPNYSG
jgi:2-polyprenyl-6-methoxyphenol hydroxylase-like FAD-dependent oxidoreductase